MNVDQIYQAQRDDAFANQFATSTYSTFLAMPFSNRGGYPHDRIKALFDRIHEEANRLLAQNPLSGGRTFDPLARVDGGEAGAVVITDEIARGILSSHFYVADLTGCNFGVVLETGIALALKPNRRVIVTTQDDLHSVHFDLRVTHISTYNEENLVVNTARTLVSAARSFESEANEYIRNVSRRLTPEAILLLNVYGQISRDSTNGRPGLFFEMARDRHPNFFGGPDGRGVFNSAFRELSERRLAETDYQPDVAAGLDRFAMHATRLGWSVIETIWIDDPNMRRPH